MSGCAQWQSWQEVSWKQLQATLLCALMQAHHASDDPPAGLQRQQQQHGVSYDGPGRQDVSLTLQHHTTAPLLNPSRRSSTPPPTNWCVI